MLSRRSARSVLSVVRLFCRSEREDCSSGDVGEAVARMRRYELKRWRVEVRVLWTSLRWVRWGLGSGIRRDVLRDFEERVLWVWVCHVGEVR